MKLKNKDIAKMLGISAAAVSMAINGKPGVSAETREKVFEILEKNRAAEENRQEKKLEPAQSGTILLIVHKKNGAVINNVLFTNLFERIQQEAMKYGYMLNIMHFVPGQDIRSFVESVKRVTVDGIILMATEMHQEDLDFYKEIETPMILLDSTFDLETYDSVNFDNQTAIYRAFDYAYKMGHRNIGFLKSKTFINNFGHHLDGFYKGIRDYHLEEYNHPVIQLSTFIDEAYEEMKAFLETKPEDFQMPTLFLADLDHLALGAMKALKEYGYKIPEDVSLIGYDDISACKIAEPPLTTVGVNTDDIGRIAVDRLIHRMKEPGDYHVTITVSSKMVLRESVSRIME